MPASSAKQAYSREEVRRVLAVSERQLRSWERQKLIPASESFSFKDLLALRTLAGLRASKVPPARIRSVLFALRERLAEVQDPLAELKIYTQGTKVRVQLGGNKMEPISGQLLLDFDETVIKSLLAFPPKSATNEKALTKHRNRNEAERWFEKGLQLEHAGAPIEEIIAAYRKAADIDPASAGALVNLGTVYFNLRDFAEAERQYLKALEIDGSYALAHFNLANLFDEIGERSKALSHYLSALEIHPNYADAHYNIALLYQSTNQTMKAVRHWRLYLKLDSSSSWGEIARRELSKLMDSTLVRGTRSREP